MKEQKKKNGKYIIITAGIIVLGLAAASYHFGRKAEIICPSEHKESAEEKKSVNDEKSYVRIEELKKKIIEIRAKYSQKNAGLLEKAASEMDSETSRKMDSARTHVRNVTDELCTFKNSFRICYYLAKDKTNGGHETYDKINEVVRKHITCKGEEALVIAESSVARLNYALASSSNDMAVEIMSESKVLFPEGEPKFEHFRTLIDQTISLNPNIASVAISKVTIAIGVAVEVVFIKATYECVKRVLIAIAQRLGTTGAAAATAVIADGPLPIGDVLAAVVTIGGLTWSAYDIYKAQEVLIPEIQGALRSSIGEYQRNLQDSTKARMRSLVDEYENMNIESSDSIIAKLEEK